MKILIIIFCLVLLFRDKKEGWGFFKKAANSVGNTVSSVANTVARVIVDPMIAVRAAQEALRQMQELIKKQHDCVIRQMNFNNVATERALWSQKLSNLKNPARYRDTNFNNEFSNYYQNDLIALNNYIDKNTQYNNELNGALKRIKIMQTNNKRLLDLLNDENKKLKECNLNKELTDNDYEVLL